MYVKKTKPQPPRRLTMVNAERIARNNTWIIEYKVYGIAAMAATNRMGIPASSEEKAVDYFKRIYCDPEKVMHYEFVRCLGHR